MAEMEKDYTVHDYLEIGLRRKWYIIIPSVLSLFIAFGVYKILPKVYKTTTVILVQSQRVPENYVRATITDSVASRLNTISQEILSRTRLEQVIKDFNLFGDLRDKVPMEGLIEMMRKTVEVKVQNNPQNERGQNSFSISYEGKDPRAVMMVTNKLASMFIEENLRVRESQAEGTSEFLTRELTAMENQLKRKEADIRNFKERNMGVLPTQLDANLRILERLQNQLKTSGENRRAAEDRSVIFQSQIEQLKLREKISRDQQETPRTTRRESGSVPGTEETGGGERFQEDPLVTQLNNLKRDLAGAQAKYKDTHPDVIDLKRKIARLEPRVKEVLEKQEAERIAAREARLKSLRARREENIVENNLPPPMPDPNIERLLTQYTEQYNSALLEVKRTKEEEKNLKEEIAHYQRRIEETPKREQELTLLTRDYDLLKTNYQSLLDKKLQAQMAENLERKQQGEQFKILDPARLPETPISPDRNKILLMGAAAGLALGLGLAWFRETMDQTFHSVSDLETALKLPVLATIPDLKDEKKAA
jgi:polysaccharide chain length determinant protein (PEP-CTERM system associated)